MLDAEPNTSRTIRVLIVSDVRLFRDGLALVLGRESDEIASIGQASDVATAAAAVRETEPDVVLLDGAMADAAWAVAELTAADRDARVVVLSVRENELEVIEYAEAGVAGYVTRDADAAVLCQTIEAVDRGETLCSPQLAALLLRRVASLASERAGAHVHAHLTVRELEVVALIDRGLSNKEIAQALGIEVATVKNHVHNILDKLGVHRRAEAAAALRE